MKKKIDFILEDHKGLYKDIFRFYPRPTHVHGFGDDAPTTWDKVYKVYYSWAIIRQHYNDEETGIEPESTMKLFEMPWDECSMIPNLSAIIKNVIETGETFDYPTFGQPAGEWRIEKIEYKDWSNAPVYLDEDDEALVPMKTYYKFQVFDNWYNNGYRFLLTPEETLAFCDYLDKINEYALAHSEGI